MREGFAKRPLARRVVALALAYVLALSGIIGSFGAASTATAPSGGLGLITCHGGSGGQRAPGGDSQNGAPCDSSCCIGCLLLTAALPPPPAIAVGAPQSSLHRLTNLAVVDFTEGPQTRSHQSRAPPSRA